MNNRLFLLSTVAFANPGVQTIAAYNQAPDPTPLRQTVEAMNEDVDTMEKRAPDMAAMVPYWDKTDAIVEGQDAVRNARQTYLPKFADETVEEYDVRLGLTKMTNIYRDTVEGLASKPFEEEISIVETTKPVSEEIKKFVEDVDGAGNNLTSFASLTFFNGINSAIDWILVDYPVVDRSKIVTVADKKAAGIQPYWTHVLGRNVYEARTVMHNGKRQLSYVRIFEPGLGEPDHMRIFKRDENGVINWELWRKSDNGEKKYYKVGEGTLSIDVIPLVPFYTGRRDGRSWKIFPAMQDAADLQIKLYQNESALEFISTMAGYPMLAANGMRPQMEADGKTAKKVAVGPAKLLWGVPDGSGNHGEWKYVEPSAQSMEFLQKKIDATKQDLRELGRQPLTSQTGNLTVITAAMAAGKARSAVSAWALGLKDALENALLITWKWLSGSNTVDYEPEVNVYTEFDSFADGNNDMTVLTEMRKNGDLSRETLWAEAKRRKILSPEFEDDTEIDRILSEIPGDTDLENKDDNTDPEQQPGNAA